MKSKLKLVGIICFLIAVGIYMTISYISTGKEELIKNCDEEIYEEVVSNDINEEENKNEIVVEIKGAVKSPNVYWLTEGSIIGDLIEKAGGLTESADIAGVNRAEQLKNHQLVIVPDKNNVENNNENVNILRSQNNNLRNDIVNINTADEKELDTLPGVGPAKAQDIISYREENGAFKSIEDIKNVKGIGESSYEKLKDKITV